MKYEGDAAMQELFADTLFVIGPLMRIFPPGMPAPVEMFAAECSQNGIDNIRGVVIILERLEPQP